MQRFLMAVSITAVAGFLLAGGSVPAPPASPPGSEQLSILVGKWTGEAEFSEPGKPAAKVKVRIDCRKTSGGWAVLCDTAMTSPEMNYLETDLFGYDDSTAKVHWYGVTNAGEVHDHAGVWKNDRELVVRHTGKAGDENLTEDVTLRFEGNG